MKNATKHAETLKTLSRKLLKEHPAPELKTVEPLLALVRGAMSYDVSDELAGKAMAAIDREFVDLNELRVATELEVQELLGMRYPAIEDRVSLITDVLNAIFEKEHTLSLERLKSIGRKEARQFIRDLPDISPFIEGYVMLFGFGQPAIPVDQTILGYLREEKVVGDDADCASAQKFLETQVKGSEHAFFHALRTAAFAEGRTRKK